MSTTTATKAKTKSRKKDMVPCQCFTRQTGEVQGTPVFGSCGGKTQREFAPGHDARLKGVLIRAHLAGQQYRVEGDKPKDPMLVAKTRGWETFLAKAADREGRRAEAKAAREQARASAKAEREQAKAAKAEAKAEAKTSFTKVKIGRATYDIDKIEAMGPNEATVRYTDKSGNMKEKQVKLSALS